MENIIYRLIFDESRIAVSFTKRKRTTCIINAHMKHLMFKLTFVFVIIMNFVFKRIVFQMKMVAIGGVSLVFLCAFKLVNVYFTHYHFYPF